MLNFTSLGENVKIINEYIQNSGVNSCDYSLGVKYMWRKDYVNEYAIFNDTLILKESCKDYENRFYYPMGKDVSGALKEIENYCKTHEIPLTFCWADNATATSLSEFYPLTHVTNDRTWSDYIYDAKAFANFVGKKYSGQRNHINKFTKLYPDYKFSLLTKEDFPKIKEFLKTFEIGQDFSAWTKREEEKHVLDLVEKMQELNQVGAKIEVGGKIVALSVGEIVGDTLIVHVEKALREYDGVYPTMANAFAKQFSEKVKFINREDDSGDMGLRISKLQYHPLEIKEKNFVSVLTLFDKISAPVLLKTQNLVIDDITEKDKYEYFSLYTNEEINEFYGYDFREDYKGKGMPDKDYFIDFMKGLKAKKQEYSLCVRKDGKMIGEIVLYNFGYHGESEIGFRFFKEYRGFGYARESVLCVLEYAKTTLGAKKINARAFKQNDRSINLLVKCGFIKTNDSATQNFYSLSLK